MLFCTCPHRYQTTYQVGVLVSRSSLRCVKIRHLSVLALLQVCVPVYKKTQNGPHWLEGGGWSTHQRAALVVMDAAMQPFSVM